MRQLWVGRKRYYLPFYCSVEILISTCSIDQGSNHIVETGSAITFEVIEYAESVVQITASVSLLKSVLPKQENALISDALNLEPDLHSISFNTPFLGMTRYPRERILLYSSVDFPTCLGPERIVTGKCSIEFLI